MPFSLEPEGILHITSRMRLWHIDRIEVEILSGYLHAVIDIESHPHKCILYLPLHKCNRMKASLVSNEGDRKVFYLCRESLGDEFFFDTFALSFECLSDDITSLIGGLSDRSSLFHREVLESLEDGSELASLSEDIVSIGDEGIFIMNV